MSESTVPVLVPEGKAATDLTMGELDTASYNLGVDVLEAISVDGHPKRYAGFIEIAWLWAKRQDQKAKRDTFRDYEPNDLFQALRMDEDDQEGSGDPTPPADSPNGEPSASP